MLTLSSRPLPTGFKAALCALVGFIFCLAVLLCLIVQPVYAQDAGISEQAKAIAAQYGVDPDVVQQMLDASIPAELIDLAMIEEFLLPPAGNPFSSADVAPLLAPAQVLTQEVVLESCSSQNFPYVFLNISVRENGSPVLDLASSNFQCSENGFQQSNDFTVTPPQLGGGVRMADIVFLIDTSGSMGDEIAGVRQNVSDFAQSLNLSDVDFRLGLVQFGNSSGPNPGLFNGGNLTADVPLFTSFIDTLRANGGYEPGFLAIRMAIQGFNFRPGAQKVFLMITDEDSDDRDKQTTLDLLQANDVTVHVAANCSQGYSQSDYCDTTSVRAATGGILFGIVGPYDQILDEISERTASTYVLSYSSSNPTYDGANRSVVCSVTTPAWTESVACSYTPGAEPQITLTTATLELNKKALGEGTSPVIAVQVVDNVPPGVQSVTLHYRTTGSGFAYQSAPMVLAGNNIYTAAIPSVTQPGVNYYVRATDGQLTSQLPAQDPGEQSFQISVLPNVKPAISHTPLAVAPKEANINLTATITDKTNSVVAVELRWKYANELIYRRQPMSAGVDDLYTGIIAGANVRNDIEYYIAAVDDLGVRNSSGDADNPHFITVADFSGMTISFTTSRIVHFGEKARVTTRVTRNGSTWNTLKIGYEVLSGPNVGMTEADKRGFCITIFGWQGPCIPGPTGELVWQYPYDGSKGIGRDEIRAYADINENGSYDQGEPFATGSLNWYEHVTYGALGDSYSSGEGVGDYIDGTDEGNGKNVCHRSKKAFSQLLAPYPYDERMVKVKGTAVTFLACSGARTPHIIGNDAELGLQDGEAGNGSGPSGMDEPFQSSSLEATDVTQGVELVTISIGGNDTRWPEVLKWCLFETNCRNYTVEGTGKLLPDWIDAQIAIVESRLRVTLQKLKGNSPDAALLLVGYPPMFPRTEAEQKCGDLANPVWGLPGLFAPNDNWSPDEQNMLRTAVDKLNDKLAAVAAELEINFIDPRDKFAGHEVCGSKGAYIFELFSDLMKMNGQSKSFHPNEEGQKAYQAVVEEYLKQQIVAGAPLNKAGMPLRPASAATSAQPQSPSTALTSQEIAAIEAVQFVGLEIEETALFCDATYGSLSGGAVRIWETGLAPGSSVKLELKMAGLDDLLLPSAIVDANGRFEATITLPQTFATTVFSIIAIGAAPSGNTLVAITDLLLLYAQQPPCTGDDTATTQIERAVAIDVLANDSAGAAPLDPSTVAIVAQPDHGTVRIDVTSARPVYEPSLGFFGEDSFVYHVCDQIGVCAEGFVKIGIDAGCTITGTEDADMLVGSDGADVICGLGGDDLIDGGAGNDVILAGSGHDSAYGGPGDDRVFGGTGENVVAGGDGVDLVVPGSSALLTDESETKIPSSINALLTAGVAGAVHNPEPQPNAPYGVYMVTLTFTNTTDMTLASPFFRVTTLTQNNFLSNSDTGPSGAGAVKSVAPADLGPNGILDGGESFSVTLEIGIVTPRGFNLALDAYATLLEADAPPAGASEGFQFVFGEESLQLVQPLYLPAIIR